MSHDHSRAPADYGRSFALGVALNVGYVAVEAGYGFRSGSPALLAEAGHDLSDAAGLLLAWGGFATAERPPSARRPTADRPPTDRRPTAGPMAGGGRRRQHGDGVAVLRRAEGGRERPRGVPHTAADAAVPPGVVVAGLLIRYTGSDRLDPATGLPIAAVIFAGTWGLLREAFDLGVRAAPAGVDVAEVRASPLCRRAEPGGV